MLTAGKITDVSK